MICLTVEDMSDSIAALTHQRTCALQLQRRPGVEVLQLHSLAGSLDFKRVASLAPTLRRLVLLRQSATIDVAYRIAVLMRHRRGLQVGLNPAAPRFLQGGFLLNTSSCCRQRQSAVTDPA